MEWGERGDKVALSDSPKRKKWRVVSQLHPVELHSVNITVIFLRCSFFSREQGHLPGRLPLRFGLRPQGPCRLGTGESGLVLSEEGNPAGLSSCSGKNSNLPSHPTPSFPHLVSIHLFSMSVTLCFGNRFICISFLDFTYM